VKFTIVCSVAQVIAIVSFVWQ